MIARQEQGESTWDPLNASELAPNSANGLIPSLIAWAKSQPPGNVAIVSETIDDSGSMTAGDLIRRLNQQIKGWTMYHRHAVSKRTFQAVDHRIFWKLMRWCRRRHRKKSWKWIKKKYFQRVGSRDWVFTGMIRDSQGKAWPIQLMHAAGVKILRWVKIRSAANPYDPEWELYLEQRSAWKLTHTLAGRGRIEYLWKKQQGRCMVCGQALRIEEQPWHIHHRVWRSQGGQETCDNLEMLHANCHRQIHSKKESLKDQAASCEGR